MSFYIVLRYHYGKNTKVVGIFRSRLNAVAWIEKDKVERANNYGYEIQEHFPLDD